MVKTAVDCCTTTPLHGAGSSTGKLDAGEWMMSSVEIPQGHQAGKEVQEINMGHQPSEIHFVFSCGHKKVAYWGNPYQANLAEHYEFILHGVHGWLAGQWLSVGATDAETVHEKQQSLIL